MSVTKKENYQIQLYFWHINIEAGERAGYTKACMRGGGAVVASYDCVYLCYFIYGSVGS